MSPTTVSPAIERVPSSCLSLASIRERKGLTLDEIARATRIAPRYLQAIEVEEFAMLPGGVYNISYIRQYARAVGFSEATLLDQYHARKGEESAPVLTLQQSSRPKTRLGETVQHLFAHLSTKPRTHHSA
jgi:cytoskeletal protein RodZ